MGNCRKPGSKLEYPICKEVMLLLKDLKKVTFGVIILLLIGGCGTSKTASLNDSKYSTQEIITRLKKEKISLGLSHNIESNGTINVSGGTNLPDFATLQITLYKTNKDGTLKVYGQIKPIVDTGKYHTALGPWDSPLTEGDYILEVVFSPIDQSPRLKQVFGEKGEKIAEYGAKEGNIEGPNKITGITIINNQKIVTLSKPLRNSGQATNTLKSDQTKINTTYLYNGTGSVAVAINENSMDEALDAAIAKDDQRFEMLFVAGRLMAVPDGTSVRIVHTGLARTQVQILEGKYSSQTGYVQTEFVKVK